MTNKNAARFLRRPSKPKTHKVIDEDGLVSVATHKGEVLLKECFSGVQLTNGVQFSLHAMQRTVHRKKGGVIVEAGGDNVLPKLSWHITPVDAYTTQFSLSITNTTPEPLPIERLDVLISRGGYKNISSDALFIRRTGWQTFSPAAIRLPFTARDPWLQPPLSAPMLLPSSGDQWQLPWMTILQTNMYLPLLVGFGGAKNYLSTIDIRSSSRGHRITATNQLEGVSLAPGQTFTSEPLLICHGQEENDLLDTYGNFLRDYMSVRVSRQIPTGWSHWLYYFAKVTEQDILENARIIAEKDLPFEYVQVDDGYQTLFGDWLSVNDKFPHGMKYVADEIRKTGRKPGIWLSPFMADARSEVFTQHPDWFLKDAAGNHINVNRHGDPYWPAPNYGLDVTHPGAYKWLKHVLTTICHEWGYEYLKMDFLYAGAIRAVRHDTTVTSVQAYRRGMELIRSVAGDRVILGCGAPLLCSAGLVDDMRIGPDLSWEFDLAKHTAPVDMTRPQSRDPIMSLFGHMWMNKKLWINDTDYIRTRQHDINMEWPQTVALTSLIAMSGGALYDSDNLASLEPEGYDLLSRLFPAADITTRPVGRITGKPSKLLATAKKGATTWYVAAKFNWKTLPQSSIFIPMRWGLKNDLYHIYDLIEKKYIGLLPVARLGNIPPEGVSLYSVCAAKNIPQVIATDGHLLGPAGDIAGVVWKKGRLTIKLSEMKRARPSVLVHVPPHYRFKSAKNCVVADKKGFVLEVTPEVDEFHLDFTRFLSWPSA